MPSYISHAIMADDVYNRLENKKVSLDYLRTFSLGGDLARFSKCYKKTHHEKQLDFISNMVSYINRNNLANDERCLGILYGHICHYFMDKNIHPLIYKIDKYSQRVKANSHALIEGYYDAYLVSLKYNLDISKYKTKKIFKGKILNYKSLINDVYMETYGAKNVSLSYFLDKQLYRLIRLLFVIVRKNNLIKISHFNDFIKLNSRLYEYNDDFIKLYNKSIDDAVTYINNIQKKLFIL